jgi:hypothetical protein
MIQQEEQWLNQYESQLGFTAINCIDALRILKRLEKKFSGDAIPLPAFIKAFKVRLLTPEFYY